MAWLTNSGVSYMAMWVAPSTMCRLLSRLPARLKGVLAEPERSGPAAGDEPEGLGQKLACSAIRKTDSRSSGWIISRMVVKFIGPFCGFSP